VNRNELKPLDLIFSSSANWNDSIIFLVPSQLGVVDGGLRGAHYWAREFQQLGHEVHLINPKFVKPFVKSNKNDTRDAEAICEAVTRPTMRFVPVKTVA
jgi:hypothetical protein